MDSHRGRRRLPLLQRPQPAFQKRVSVKRSYGICGWGRTHIAVEREYTEWRDHRASLMWHPTIMGQPRASLTCTQEYRIYRMLGLLYMAYPRFRTGCTYTHSTPCTGGLGSLGHPGVGIDDISSLHMQAQRQACGRSRKACRNESFMRTWTLADSLFQNGAGATTVLEMCLGSG